MNRLINNKYIYQNDFNIIKKLISNNFLSFFSNSFKYLLDTNKDKLNLGINKILNNIFPIYNKTDNILINCLNYYVLYPNKTHNNCILNGSTYYLTIRFRLLLINYNQNYKLIEDLNYLEIPFITSNNTFIINGVEKCFISQLVRSSGIVLLKNKIKKSFKNFLKLTLNDDISIIFYIINKKFIIKYKNYSLNLIHILFYLGLNKLEIIDKFYNYEDIYFYKNKFKLKLSKKKYLNFNFKFNLKYEKEILLNKYKFISNQDLKNFRKYNINYITINKNYFLNKILGCNLYYKKKKIAKINDVITIDLLKKIVSYKINYFKIINFSSDNHNLISSNLCDIKNFNFYINFFNNFLIDNNIILVKNKFCYKKNNLNNFNFNYNVYFSNIYEKNVNKNYLSINDFISIIKILLSSNDNIITSEDFQNLKNLKLKFISNIIEEIIFKGFINSKSNLISNCFNYNEPIKLYKHFDTKTLNKKILKIFIISEYSQFLDQTNILSELSHKRKVSFLAIKGISRDYSGFDVRDSNTSYYNRLCPVETPEGINIGLINYLSILSFTDVNNNIISFYYKVLKNNNLSKKVYILKSSYEKNFILTDLNSYLNNDVNINARYNNQLIDIKKNLIDYVDVIKGQFLSISAMLVPFLEHNDSNRSLMASNMLKQALPILFPEPPIINTGIEKLICYNELYKYKSLIKFSDNKFIIFKKFINNKNKILNFINIYFFKNYINSNQNTIIGKKNIYKYNDKIFPNELIFDTQSSVKGSLSLGRNLKVAFMSWFGYNFEDSIIISEKLLINNSYTSLNVFIIDIPIYYKENSRFCNNIVNEKNLDKNGFIKVGSIVSTGDILIKRKKILKENKKLIFKNLNNKNNDNDEESIFLKENILNGTVTDVKIYFSKNFQLDNIDLKLLKNQKFNEFKLIKYYFNFFLNKIYIKNCKNINYILRDKYIMISIKKKIYKFILIYLNMFNDLKKKYYKNLYFDVKKLIKIKIIVKKYLQVGDKMSGRHGNKGVICKILPINEMPYMINGWDIDILLNPLGVSARMNIGQLLEVHLGLASIGLSCKINNLIKKNDINNLVLLLKKIYFNKNIDKLNFKQIMSLANYISSNGIPFGAAPFNDLNKKNIDYFLNLAFNDTKLEISKNKKQFYLYDGITGKKFENPVTLGLMYILKLDHLVENKIHYRSIGPYSLITQQPLKGKKNSGGQRLGEMEVWALQAYGAAYTLQEMITVKSDDLKGRFEIYKNIVNGSYKFISNTPRSFEVMINNINSLGLYIKLK